MFLLLLAGAGIFFGMPGIDWKERFASMQRAVLEPQAAQPAIPAPARTAAVPPSFDAVSADGGMLVAAGKAEPGSTVLLQSGGRTVAETKADENGEWVVTEEKPLAAGPYELSIVAIDPKTQVPLASRKSYAFTVTPVEKKAPVQTASGSAPSPGAVQASKPVEIANVKAGDTLWAITERYYGKGAGARYHEIAGANKEQIKNPNLIFPNQQFTIPGKN
jgi:nucleoid-associated protein YgaU